jgi:type II secretory pathway predicted ATPase ExeA
MYTAYWGLAEKPFENTPDPRFLYYSQQHEEAMARMLYVVREKKGAALLTGEYGCGKTLLSRVLKNELQQENKYQSIYIIDPRLLGLEFIQEVVYQLSGSSVPQSKIDLFHSIYKLLYANYSAGKHTVLVIDEAQAIKSKRVFEELRLLVNFQLENAFLMTVILLGSPELKSAVTNLPQLLQRMAVRYHLNSLNEKETKEYVMHRLKVAGATRQICTEDAYHEIYLSACGVPRRINNVCDLALLIGLSSSLKVVDRKTIREINDDIEIPMFEEANIYRAPSNAPQAEPQAAQNLPGVPG